MRVEIENDHRSNEYTNGLPQTLVQSTMHLRVKANVELLINKPESHEL
jgi:hypothetical protein